MRLSKKTLLKEGIVARDTMITNKAMYQSMGMSKSEERSYDIVVELMRIGLRELKKDETYRINMNKIARIRIGSKPVIW